MKKSLICCFILLGVVLGCQGPDLGGGDSPGQEIDDVKITFGIADGNAAPQTKAEPGTGVLIRDSVFTVEMVPLPPVAETFSMQIMPETKTTPVTTGSLRSFYVNTTKGSQGTLVAANTVFTGSQATNFTAAAGMAWPMTDEGYHFYASNETLQSAAGSYTRVSCPAGKDVIYASCVSPAFQAVNTLAFNHVYARIGDISVSTQDGSSVTIKDISIYDCPQSGVFDVASGSWVSTVNVSSQELDSHNDLWIVPGTYEVGVVFDMTDSYGNTVEDIVRSGNVTFSAGKVHNIYVNVADRYERDLVISPYSATIDVGSTMSLSATYYLYYFDGTSRTEIESRDVTNDSYTSWYEFPARGYISFSGNDMTGERPGRTDAWCEYYYDGVHHVRDLISVTVNDVVSGKDYRNLVVRIAADPASVGAVGGTSTLTWSASYQQRDVYASGSYGDWSTVIVDPADITVSGSADGFSRNGATVTVAANTGEERSVTYTASYSVGSLSGSADATITQSGDAVASYEYRNLSVSISADPASFGAAGGTSTLTYSATYETREVYVSGAFGEWTSVSVDPEDITVSGSAAGFTRSGSTVTVGVNSGNARSVTYTASYSIGSLSGSDSATITQAADSVVSQEYRNLVVSISANPASFTASGGTSTLSYSATYEVRDIFESGASGSWTSVTAEPEVSGSAAGFTRSGHTVTVAQNTGNVARSVTYTASYSVGSLSDSESATITQAANQVDHVEYRNLNVTINSSPSTFSAAGGTSALTATATWQYRVHYTNGQSSGWTQDSDTPAITDSGDEGFSRSGMTVVVSPNTTMHARDFTCYATYSVGGLSGSDYVTISQDADSVDHYGDLDLSQLTLTVDDIPASGGSISSGSLSGTIRQTRYYVSGDVLTSEYTVSQCSVSWSSPVSGSNLGTTVTPRTRKGSLTATVSKNGKSATISADVYQEANESESEYRNLTVTISANPDNIPASGGTSTLSWSGTYEERSSYTSGATTSWSAVAVSQSSISVSKTAGSSTGFTLSGHTVTVAQNTGSSSRYAVYTASCSFAGMSDSDDARIDQAGADVTTYRYKVVTEVSPSTITVGGTAAATATLYKMTYVNGSATTGWVQEGDVTSSGFKKQSGNGGVSFSGSTISGTSAGTATIRSNYSADEYEDDDLTIIAETYKVVTELSEPSIYVGETVTATATLYVNRGSGWTYVSDVTSSGFKKQSGGNIVSISGSTIEGTGAGSVTIRSNYSADEYEDASLTISAVTVVGTEYRNLVVSISASPDNIPASGGTSTLTYSATWEYRYEYSNGTYGEWISDSATPTVSGSATGFSRNGTNVTVTANNSTSPRSVTYTASYTIGNLSDSDSATITQAGKVVLESIVINDAYAYSWAPVNSVAYGDYITFTCTAYYSDGTTEDVTSSATWGVVSGANVGYTGNVYTCTSNNISENGVSRRIKATYSGKTANKDITIYPKYAVSMSIVFGDSFSVNDNSKPKGNVTYNDGSTGTVQAGGLAYYQVYNNWGSVVQTYDPGDDVDMSELGAGSFSIRIYYTFKRYGSDHTLDDAKNFTVHN